MKNSTKALLVVGCLTISSYCLAQSLGKFGNEDVRTFLKANPSYRYMDKGKSKEGDVYVFVSPYPNKRYPAGYTPDKPTQFHSIDIKSDGSAQEVLMDVECIERKFYLSTPDKDGVFRRVVWGEALTPILFKSLCEADWSKEVGAARKELKEMVKK